MFALRSTFVGLRWVHFAPAILIALLLSLSAGAQEDLKRTQVSAAAADALETLRHEILAASILPSLTVRDLVDRTRGQDELNQTLRGAEQIGGTRWLDDQTCQVRLELAGGAVAKTLTRLAHDHPEKLGVPVAAVDQRLATWDERTFSATGTSTGSRDIERLRPPASDRAWQAVPDKARRAAIASARDDAIRRVIDSLRPIQFDTDKKLDDALRVPEVGDAVRGWLGSRPVRSIEFLDDLTVRLTLAAPPEDLFAELRSALERKHEAPAPAGTAGWDRLREQVLARAAAPVGTAVAQANDAMIAKPAVVLPANPPSWANKQLDAEGVARGGKSPLLVGNKARAVALENLRTQINSLPLTRGTTV